MDGGGNDVGLFEIDDRGAERQQAHPQPDAEQIGRTDELEQSRKGAAADALRRGVQRAVWIGMHSGGTLEPIDAEHCNFEQQSRDNQQIGRPQWHGKLTRHRRSEQGAGGAAGADEAEQALTLVGREQVGHERPEHRHREQAE